MVLRPAKSKFHRGFPLLDQYWIHIQNTRCTTCTSCSLPLLSLCMDTIHHGLCNMFHRHSDDGYWYKEPEYTYWTAQRAERQAKTHSRTNASPPSHWKQNSGLEMRVISWLDKKLPASLTALPQCVSYTVIFILLFELCYLTTPLTGKDYKASLIDEWMNMEHWWKDIDRWQPMYWQRHLFHYHFPHMRWSGIEPGEPPCQVST